MRIPFKNKIHNLFNALYKINECLVSDQQLLYIFNDYDFQLNAFKNANLSDEIYNCMILKKRPISLLLAVHKENISL